MFKSAYNLVIRLGGYIPSKYRLVEAGIIYYVTKIFKLNPGAMLLDIKDVKRFRDRIFIMGSGYSIREISEQEWNHFRENGDIFAFNYFFRGRFIPITFHIVREMGVFRTVLRGKNIFKSYCDGIFNNPCYKNTIFFVLYDSKAPATTWSVFFLKLFKNRKICFYRNLPDRALIRVPSDNINNMPHCGSTLFDAMNIAYLMGYKEIVLVGVDLYDRRYFWLQENETRDLDLKRWASFSDIHNTANTTLKAMGVWKEYLTEKGVELYIYNPRSLLCAVLPLYKLIVK